MKKLLICMLLISGILTGCESSPVLIIVNVNTDPTPTSISTPIPTPSPNPIIVPEPTPTPASTPVIVPEPTPTPASTPVIALEPTPTPASTPVIVPEPTPTPTSTPVIVPEPTPTPTSTVDLIGTLAFTNFPDFVKFPYIPQRKSDLVADNIASGISWVEEGNYVSVECSYGPFRPYHIVSYYHALSLPGAFGFGSYNQEPMAFWLSDNDPGFPECSLDQLRFYAQALQFQSRESNLRKRYHTQEGVSLLLITNLEDYLNPGQSGRDENDDSSHRSIKYGDHVHVECFYELFDLYTTWGMQREESYVFGTHNEESVMIPYRRSMPIDIDGTPKCSWYQMSQYGSELEFLLLSAEQGSGRQRSTLLLGTRQKADPEGPLVLRVPLGAWHRPGSWRRVNDHCIAIDGIGELETLEPLPPAADIAVVRVAFLDDAGTMPVLLQVDIRTDADELPSAFD